MAGDGKQANRCRAPWLWARNGLSRSAHVSESRRTSIHNDTTRGYRDHGFKSEHPFARANRIRTKRHSNPLSAWSKCRPIIRREQMPLALLACGSIRSLCTRPWYGRAFAWRPMQHRTRRRTSARGEPPHAIRCPIRRLHENADTASFYSAPASHKRRKAPAHSTFDFGCGFRVETDTAQKDGSFPCTSPPCAQP